MNLKEAVDKAVKELNTITDKDVAGVIGASRKDGNWHIEVEIVERKALPDSQDLLAAYEVVLDKDGRIMNYERHRIRRRNESYQEVIS